jgi:hypothetical protein
MSLGPLLGDRRSRHYTSVGGGCFRAHSGLGASSSVWAFCALQLNDVPDTPIQ